ncbi:MAG TPA: FAD-dependent oxidoreductase [Phenylobacterium sp.]|nr:FAD-dependent oxidoreductase [Phenylobacterium sp.]
MSERPVRIVVIGGGCASMAAVWELSRPEHRQRYEITVFQEGWRLGGKGASGRGPDGRIEEHGLHIWLGFYDNAFRMMRECHAELEAQGAAGPYGDWRDAWTPENDIALFSVADDGGFERWDARMPPRPGLPGDPLPAGEVFSLPYYVARAFELFRALVLDTKVEGHGLGPAPDAQGRIEAGEALTYLLGLGGFATAATLAEGLGVAAALIRGLRGPLDGGLVAAIEAICGRLRAWVEARWLAPDRHRFLWEIADLTLASIVGLLRHGVMFDPRGLDAIDDYECREWLQMNGASARALQSPFLRGLYDLSMGYEDGDLARPRLSAGQGLRGTLRTFFGYRGAFMWRMRAGMGDVVFAPLYDALSRRGVQFRFFHRLTNVGPAPADGSDGAHVRSLTFDVQAKPCAGADYQPLVCVSGRPCWPSAPDFAQLEDGARMRDEHWDFESHWDRRRTDELTLTVGRDFDFVLLGVGLGAIPHVAGELVAHDPRWRRMTQEVKTVASQAFQVWLNEDLQSLGWRGPAYITGAFAKPFDTWCDMAHVVPEEGWAEPPRTSVYFCAVLPDPPVPPGEADAAYPGRRADEVRAAAEAFLEGPIREVWPGAFDAAGGFRWDLLVAPSHAPLLAGSARFSTQYWRANVNPSDRYVIHTPGSYRYRISPLDMTYDNLTIAGDWTDSGFHSGCVEGAVMSGLLAAHALSGSPKLEDIIGYDHP